MSPSRFCKQGHDKDEGLRTPDGTCKACHKAANRVWDAANPEKRRAFTRAWHAANPEKVRAAKRAWRAAHPGQVRTTRRAWDAAHLEERRAATRAWRARKVGNGVGFLPAYDYVAVVNGATHCGICQRRYKKGDTRELDHIIPISQGGADSLENVQSAHATCNSGKRDRITPGTQYPLGYKETA